MSTAQPSPPEFSAARFSDACLALQKLTGIDPRPVKSEPANVVTLHPGGPKCAPVTIDRVLGIASDATIARLKALRDVQVPVVENLDQQVYEATKDGKDFDMGSWHCGTTHCRAGWAITLAGEAGHELESRVGPHLAGRLIYEASTGRIAPDFFASTRAALADIKRCAGVEA